MNYEIGVFKMAINVRTSQEKTSEKFINEMADKPYGNADRLERITISLNGKLYDKVDELVRKRRRNKEDNRTLSAFIREALEQYIRNMN